MFEGVRFDLGVMCRLIINGVDVIVASRAEQIFDVEPFAMHGLDVTGYKVVAIKGPITSVLDIGRWLSKSFLSTVKA
ncbi:hypothetical protein CBM2606_A150092 [Cupriavidus taiwanensis]|nr:hypothetical protein CBM2606_A150092 [Cupriavidus taiwanensis]